MASSDSKKTVTDTFLYEYEFITRIHDIDAAGVLFFARNLYYAHDAYEAFLIQSNQSIDKILKSDFVLPISHTEASFKTPVFLNEAIRVKLFLTALTEDEFSLHYEFINPKGRVCSTANTTHVCLNSTNHKRMKLPEALISMLKK